LLGATNYGAKKIRMKNIIMRKMLWHLVSHDLAMEIVEQDLATMSQQ
jgi:hypothetical protein